MQPRRGRTTAAAKGTSKFKCLRIVSRTVAVREEPSKMSALLCSLQLGIYVPSDNERVVDGTLWYHLPCGWLCSMDSNGYEATAPATDTEGQKQWAAEFDKRRRIASAICAMLTRSYSLENGRRVANAIVKHVNSGKMGPLMNLPDVSMEDLMVGLSSANGLRQGETLEIIKIAACQQGNPPKALRDIANDVLELISMRPTLWISTDRNVLETMDVRSRNDQFVMAAARGDLEMFERFLALGQELSAVHSELKYTALHAAADFGQDEIAKRLIRTGMTMDIRDARKGQTPLHFAGQGGRSGIAQLLVLAGADRTIASFTGLLPYHLAADQGFRECAEILKFAPPAVQYVTVVNVTTRTIELRWDHPVIDPTLHSRVTEYVVEWSPVGNSREVGHGDRFHVRGNTFKLRHLRPATGHGFVIFSSSLAGLSQPSSKIIQFSKPSPPDPPPTVEMLRVSINGIFLNWLPPRYNNGAKIDRYQVELVDCDKGALLDAAEKEAARAKQERAAEARRARLSKKMAGMTLGGGLDDASVVSRLGSLDGSQGGGGGDDEDGEDEDEEDDAEAADNDDDGNGGWDEESEGGRADGEQSVSSSLRDPGSVPAPQKLGGGQDIHHRMFKVSASVTAKQCMGLEPWKPYQCRVRCHNSLGYSPWSTWIGPITPQPGVYVLEFDRENRSVRAGWFKPMLSGTRRVTEYDVQLCSIEGPLSATLPIFADKADKEYLISKNRSVTWHSISERGLSINEIVVAELKAGGKYQVRVRTQVDGVWLDWALALYSDTILMPACAPECPFDLRPALKDLGGAEGRASDKEQAAAAAAAGPVSADSAGFTFATNSSSSAAAAAAGQQLTATDSAPGGEGDGEGDGEGEGEGEGEGDADWVGRALAGAAPLALPDAGFSSAAPPPPAAAVTTATNTNTSAGSSDTATSAVAANGRHSKSDGEPDAAAGTEESADSFEITHDSITLRWQNGLNNGSPVAEYALEMCKIREYRASDVGAARAVAAGVEQLSPEVEAQLEAGSAQAQAQAQAQARARAKAGAGGGQEGKEDGDAAKDGGEEEEDDEDEEEDEEDDEEDDFNDAYADNSAGGGYAAPSSDANYYRDKRRLDRKQAKKQARAEAKAAVAAAAEASLAAEAEAAGVLRWAPLTGKAAAAAAAGSGSGAGASLLGPQAFLVRQLLPGASYIFRLRVRNDYGWSPWSRASPIITTFPCLPVQRPQAVKCGPYSVYARWNEQGSDDRFMGMTNLEFEVEVGRIPSGETQRTYAVPWEPADASPAPAFAKQPGDASGSRFVAVLINNLSPATDLCMRVRVRTILGWSTWSEVSDTFRTLAAPC